VGCAALWRPSFRGAAALLLHRSPPARLLHRVGGELEVTRPCEGHGEATRLRRGEEQLSEQVPDRRARGGVGKIGKSRHVWISPGTRTIRPAEMFGRNVRKSRIVLDISAAQLGAELCGRDKSSAPNNSTPELFGPNKVAQMRTFRPPVASAADGAAAGTPAPVRRSWHDPIGLPLRLSAS
jgi:hypothetical protein